MLHLVSVVSSYSHSKVYPINKCLILLNVFCFFYVVLKYFTLVDITPPFMQELFYVMYRKTSNTCGSKSSNAFFVVFACVVLQEA